MISWGGREDKVSFSWSSDLPVFQGQAGLPPHPSYDGIREQMSLSPSTHHHKQAGDTHQKSSCAPCTPGQSALGQPSHSTRAFSDCLGSWQHRGEKRAIPTQNAFSVSSPPGKTQPEALIFSCYGQHLASRKDGNEGFCEAMRRVLAAPTSPAIIVFPQSQLKGIRSVGMVRFQKDGGRVPGQAGPAAGVSVGLPSVRVTIPLIAGFRCIYGRM